MTADWNSRHRVAIDVMDAVLEIGFDGCSIEAIARHLGIQYGQARRVLIALETSGWVEEMENAGSNQKQWRPGRAFLSVAFKYRRHCLSKVQKVEQEYTEVTGMRLRDEL